MQRLTNPVISLSSEDEVINFLETRPPTQVWDDDYSGHLFNKNEYLYEKRGIMDTLLEDMGYNTRVVAFYYDKEEYSEDIKLLKEYAQHLSNRMNLRIGMVTDPKLVVRMKKAHPEFFPEVSLTGLVLRRYDGAIRVLDLSENQPAIINWWICAKSTKPLDHHNGAMN